MRRPDFLIIGAARCGTTSLYECLKAHPQIYLPPDKRPEPHFFLREAEYRKGIEYYCRKYFDGVGDDLIAGEASTSYIYQPWVAPRIRKHLPDVKLIAMLRNPIDRAFSNYHVTRANGLEDLPFGEAIRREAQRIANPESSFHAEIQPFAYIDRGRYHKQLSLYRELFPPEQIHVTIFEDFMADTAAEIRSVLGFLGVGAADVVEQNHRKWNAADYNDERIAPADREYIRRELMDDMEKLSEFVQRDLSLWQ